MQEMISSLFFPSLLEYILREAPGNGKTAGTF